MNITLPFIIIGLIFFSINNYKTNQNFSIKNIRKIHKIILLILIISLIYNIYVHRLTDIYYIISNILLILSFLIYSLTKKK